MDDQHSLSPMYPARVDLSLKAVLDVFLKTGEIFSGLHYLKEEVVAHPFCGL
jgi:hypothetical protein